MSVDVNDESGYRPEPDLAEISDLATYVLDELRIHPMAELSVILADESVSERLHIEWMDLPGPTDVLSFPMDELRPPAPGAESHPGMLGDIVVCPQVASRQAKAAGHATADEILLLVTHGILHLLGYDHIEEADRREMFALQKELLLGFLAQRDPTRAANPPEPTID